MFIGRQNELQTLESQFNSESSNLIVLYGRRRVGKTELLSQFVQGKNVMFYSCTETTDAEQLTSFSRMILLAGHPAAPYTSSFPDWRTAFHALSEIPKDGKMIIVIDEFPYMARKNKEILPILQDLWDQTLQYRNLMLILSGSNLSFMEKAVLSSTDPLYRRATCILRLEPLNYLESASFFPERSPEDKLRTYAILGGIPHYLKQFNPALSLRDNIAERLLTNGSVLYNEVEFITQQEFRETGTYRVILGAIASGAARFSEISQLSLIEPNKLSPYLSNLIDVGLAQREFSVNTKEEEIHKEDFINYQILSLDSGFLL